VFALGSQPPCCEEAQVAHGKAQMGGIEDLAHRLG